MLIWEHYSDNWRIGLGFEFRFNLCDPTLHYLTLRYRPNITWPNNILIDLTLITLIDVKLHRLLLHYIDWPLRLILHCIDWSYITLFTWHYIIWPYVMLPSLNLHYLTLHYLTLNCPVLHYIIWPYFTLLDLTLHFLTLIYITWPLTWPNLTPPYLDFCRIWLNVLAFI